MFSPTAIIDQINPYKQRQRTIHNAPLYVGFDTSVNDNGVPRCVEIIDQDNEEKTVTVRTRWYDETTRTATYHFDEIYIAAWKQRNPILVEAFFERLKERGQPFTINGQAVA